MGKNTHCKGSKTADLLKRFAKRCHQQDAKP